MSKLSADEVDILRWWVLLLRGDISRVCAPRLPRREVIIYTDSATPTRTAAPLAIDVSHFDVCKEFRALWAETSDPHRLIAFISTTYIYGIEMLDTIATIFLEVDSPRWDVTFYIDNSNRMGRFS